MSVILVDRGDPSREWIINLWNWRAIVAAVERLDILSDDALAGLEPLCGGLDKGDARRVAVAIESRLLPELGETARLMLDGRRTEVPDDGVFHRAPEDAHLNYSTSSAVLSSLARFCAACDGFSQ